jgi:molybdopterin adenylyltransferase
MNAAILTISDTRDIDDDPSGDLLIGLLTEFGATVMNRSIVSDQRSEIETKLVEMCDSPAIDVVITTGGTGLSPRDNTPEATKAVIEREAPGIAEAMRRETAAKTPMSMLSRGVCGIRGTTLVINLPGSPKAVAECFGVVSPVMKHAVEIIQGKTEHHQTKD